MISYRFFVFTFFCLFSLLNSFAEASGAQPASVDEVISGDTIKLKGGKTLRYIGVSSFSPESTNPSERKIGNLAQEMNNRLVGGKPVTVEWDKRLRDKQGRLLGYVYNAEGTLINGEIIKAGYGKVRLVAPNLKKAELFRKLEYEAKRSSLGVWAKNLKDPNKAKRYVGEKNTKLYYFPESEELSRIPESQLVYFDSRVDAKAAGYRACPSCRETSPTEEGE